MKNLLKKIGFAALVVIAGGAVAFAAPPAAGGAASGDGLCNLIGRMYGVFKTLRTLAFVGAAFIIANWAWGYIKEPPKDGITEDLKKKGTGMLVGVLLLFIIGIILQALLSTAGLEAIGCKDIIYNWGMM